MTSAQPQRDPEFVEAAQQWKLEKLYVDLAAAKGRGLTPLEKKFLQGLLCGYSPAEISERVYQSRKSSSVRVYLSNGLYKYIQELVFRQTQEMIAVKNWSYVTNLLEKAGYKAKYQHFNPEYRQFSSFHPGSSRNSIQDWEETIDVSVFFGRKQELAQLAGWVTEKQCRLVGILGMGGVGKTALGIKLVKQIESYFDVVIWRSLRGLPPIQEFLTSILTFLCQGETVSLPETIEAKISLLMSLLRSQSCLLILDQVEPILASGTRVGIYCPGYEGYGELLRRIAEEHHRSCCILTSREKPIEMSLLEGESLVNSLCLGGLKTIEAQQLLQLQNLIGSQSEQEQLVKRYANNPLVIKIIALTIKNIFNRKITEFFASGSVLLNDIRQLLDSHFDRLSDLEQRVMYILAVNQRLVNLYGLSWELSLTLSKQAQLEALESLQRRSLIEKNSTQFTQDPLLRTYLLEKLIEQAYSEIQTPDLANLVKQILLEALLKEKPSQMNIVA